MSAHHCRRLAAGPDLRGALLAMAYLAQYPMTAALLRASQIGATLLPLRRVRHLPRSACTLTVPGATGPLVCSAKLCVWTFPTTD